MHVHKKPKHKITNCSLTDIPGRRQGNVCMILGVGSGLLAVDQG